MAKMPRESAFMPTVKCSSCGLEVEISMMGEHTCSGPVEAKPDPPVPPAPPAPSFFDRLHLNPFSTAAPPEKSVSVPIKLDTTAAAGPFPVDQLSPASLSSGSQSVSPRTPNRRSGAARPDEHSAPQIADNSPTVQGREPRVYGGFDDTDVYDTEPPLQASSPKRQGSSLLQRTNAAVPGPHDGGRKFSASSGRNAFRPRGSRDEWNAGNEDRPRTSASNMSSNFGEPTNEYGGFGPSRTQQDFEEPELLRAANRPGPFANTDSDSEAPPHPRSPSAPSYRPEGFSNGSQEAAIRPRTADRTRRPSTGPHTSRTSPPRTSLFANGKRPSVNVADEFGARNPYHSPPQLVASTTSVRSQSSRSAGSRSGRNPSDTSSFDNLMSNLQSSMDGLSPDGKVKPTPLDFSVPTPYPGGKEFSKSPRGFRSPLPGGGYDARTAPTRSHSPMFSSRGTPQKFFGDGSARDDPALQSSRNRMPQKARPDLAMRSDQREPNGVGPQTPAMQRGLRETSPLVVPERLTAAGSRKSSFSSPNDRAGNPFSQTRNMSSSHSQLHARAKPRGTAPQSARGNCKSCGDPISGKSISSADGRLTGRYHKACFVCTTCTDPFTSATFYVLNDKPYCELHYHTLNCSLCSGCGRGIEGQYLEDESRSKHHIGCFRCGDCDMALHSGYFEVSGRAYCEQDAWRRVQQSYWDGLNSRNGRGPMPMGRYGGNSGLDEPVLNRSNPGVRMAKRMTRLGMM